MKKGIIIKDGGRSHEKDGHKSRILFPCVFLIIFDRESIRVENHLLGFLTVLEEIKTGNIIINSDVNGSYNILRKFDSTIFSKENIENILTIPKIININGYINKGSVSPKAKYVA